MSIVQIKPLHVGQVKLNLKNHSPENILNNTNFCYLLFVIFQKKAKNPLFYFS
jgi:hypothetical protein